MVFEKLERFHTAVTDFFPHEGLQEIGGSKELLPTPLMPVLAQCAGEVRAAIILVEWHQAESGANHQSLIPMWSAVVDLLARLRNSNKNFSATEVDAAARLLYLASGTAWNCLSAGMRDLPPHNPRYVRVEPMAALFAICERQDLVKISDNKEQLLTTLRVELEVALQQPQSGARK